MILTLIAPVANNMSLVPDCQSPLRGPATAAPVSLSVQSQAVNVVEDGGRKFEKRPGNLPPPMALPLGVDYGAIIQLLNRFITPLPECLDTIDNSDRK